MVRADWRFEHGAPLVAVCELGRAQDLPGAVVADRRLGRDRSQDRSSDPDHAKSDPDPDAVEPGWLNPESAMGRIWNTGALSIYFLAQPYLEHTVAGPRCSSQPTSIDSGSDFTPYCIWELDCLGVASKRDWLTVDDFHVLFNS